MLVHIKSILYDIRIIIVIAFIIRLYGITQPPLEIAHNWRQTTVNMVARNFAEADFNLFYPCVDFAGNKTGITGMEFPILNACIAVCINTFGSKHWYGRLINLIVSSIGTWCFFLIVARYCNYKHAYYSTLILVCSIWFTYSRKIMPDTFAVSLALMALYCLLMYIHNGKLLAVLGYAIFTVLALLSKLPSCIVLIWVLPLVYFSNLKPTKNVMLYAIFIIACLPAVWWYFTWVPHLVTTFGFWHFFMGTTWQQGFAEIAANKLLTASRFYDSALKFTGFALFVWGCINIFNKKHYVSLITLVSSFIITLALVFKAGFTFAHHSYYIIPFVPAMALTAGYGLTCIRQKKLAIFCLAVVCIEGVLNQYHDFKIKPNEAALLNLENDLNKVEAKGLIMLNSGDNPTPMYFAHRKGWIAHNYQIADTSFINQCKTNGLKQLVILHRAFGSTITVPYPKLFTNENYTIYNIASAK